MRFEVMPSWQSEMLEDVAAGRVVDATKCRCQNLDCGVSLELPLMVTEALAIVPKGTNHGFYGPQATGFRGVHPQYDISVVMCQACSREFRTTDSITFGNDRLLRMSPKG